MLQLPEIKSAFGTLYRPVTLTANTGPRELYSNEASPPIFTAVIPPNVEGRAEPRLGAAGTGKDEPPVA